MTVATHDDKAFITLSDSGTGFSPEQAELLFDRFYRADTAEVQAVSGSGLGLSIVKTIVEFYGGSITASSEGSDRGSTFVVTLPLADVTASAKEDSRTV